MKSNLPRRALFTSAPGAFTVPANKSKPAANKPSEPANKAKRGRPVKSTGDPARDARNAQQAALMRKRRAAK